MSMRCTFLKLLQALECDLEFVLSIEFCWVVQDLYTEKGDDTHCEKGWPRKCDIVIV